MKPCLYTISQPPERSSAMYIIIVGALALSLEAKDTSWVPVKLILTDFDQEKEFLFSRVLNLAKFSLSLK